MGGGNSVIEQERAEWVLRFSVHERPWAPRGSYDGSSRARVRG